MNRSVLSNRMQRVYLFGGKSCGKSSIIEQLIFGGQSSYTMRKDLGATIDDIYIAYVDNDKGGRERISFFDTRALSILEDANQLDWFRNYVTYADAIVFVFSVLDLHSFLLLDQIKRAVDRVREKKDLPMICLANKCDRVDVRLVDIEKAQSWARSEKMKLFEVSALDRKSLLEPFTFISSRLIQPQNKSTFQQLSRKVKSANIAMEL